jgi:uncharacterized protein (TIGR02271 family)
MIHRQRRIQGVRMLDDEVVIRLLDHGTVMSADGQRLGRVGQLFRGDSDGESTWVSVDPDDAGAGLQTLVPMAGSTVEHDTLRVAYPAASITGAPQVAVGAPVSGEDERRVRAFYSLDQPATTDLPTDVLTMVRSEERLSAATQWVPVRRARLEKFEVTESRTIEVPWRREEVRVVYDELDGADAAAGSASPPAATPRPWVLMEERIVVTKEWVPAQTVRLVVERVAGEQEVTAPVRKEQVSLDPGGAADPVAPTGDAGATATD